MNELYEIEKDGFLLSTDRSRLDVPLIHHYLSTESYWAQNIPFEVVKRSIENSICFGIYSGKEQIAFARVVTDKATFAYLGDVFVLPPYRGKGLSKWMMQAIHAHPQLQNLRRWMLGTKDAHGLYEQFGWTNIAEDASKRLMQKHNPGIYKKE